MFHSTSAASSEALKLHLPLWEGTLAAGKAGITPQVPAHSTPKPELQEGEGELWVIGCSRSRVSSQALGSSPPLEEQRRGQPASPHPELSHSLLIAW